MNTEVSNEIERLKGEIEASMETLEAEKYMFSHKLLNGMGEQMMKELKNPTKPKLSTSLKYKFLRWKTIRKGNKKEGF